MRQAVFADLLEQKDFPTLARLIQLEPRADSRQALVAELFRDAGALDEFSEISRLAEFVESIGKDQDSEWRRGVFTDLVLSPPVLKRLAARHQLAEVADHLRNEPRIGVRSAALWRLVQSGEAIQTLVEQNSADFLEEAVATLPPSPERELMTAKLLLNSSYAEHLVRRQAYWPLVIRTAKQLDGADRVELLQGSLAANHAKLEDGLQAVTEAASGELRGEMRALLVSSSIARARIVPSQGQQVLITAIVNEPDANARRAYLETLMAHGGLPLRTPGSDVVEVLWGAVRQEGRAPWQLPALAQLLQTDAAATILSDTAEAQWLFEAIRHCEDASVASQLLHGVFSRETNLRAALAQSGSFEMLRLALEQPAAERRRLAALFFASPAVSRHLADAKQIDACLQLGRSESDPAIRSSCLEALIRSHEAISRMRSQERFRELWQLVRQEPAGVQQLNLIRTLFVAPGAAEDLISGELRDSFFEVVRESSGSEAKSDLLRKFFHHPTAVETLLRENCLPALLELTRSEPNEISRSDLLARLLRNPTFRRTNNSGQLSRVARQIRELKEPLARRTVLTSIVAEPETLNMLLENGQAIFLVNLIWNEPDGRVQQQVVASLAASPPVRQWLAREQDLSEPQAEFPVLFQRQDP